MQVKISHREPKKISCLKQFVFPVAHFGLVCITKVNMYVKFGFQSVKLKKLFNFHEKESEK